MFVAMTSVLMMTVMGACTIYAAEEGGSAEVRTAKSASSVVLKTVGRTMIATVKIPAIKE